MPQSGVKLFEHCEILSYEEIVMVVGIAASLGLVMKGKNATEEVGLLPIKINMIPIQHLNDDKISDFAFMPLTSRHVRFIEFMPKGHNIDHRDDLSSIKNMSRIRG
jgi:molybdenum cofactor biosynthesis enzyme MoaA